MKKIVFSSIFALIILASCSKEYTCNCGVSGTVKAEDYKVYNSKNKAKEMCDNITGDTIEIENVSGIAECEILGF